MIQSTHIHHNLKRHCAIAVIGFVNEKWYLVVLRR